ncbi:hypothetical protein AC230_13180 [Streptomyces caatingaensis]|uniref:Uncharacterized protein n=1 Tax=Streptomyces caatingaensis TaxID=1678637 RepID=A0A0K9XG87_9ACTN|nr:hypothetical protein AC230_13180 [Streptomyces caatingaensis]
MNEDGTQWVTRTHSSLPPERVARPARPAPRPVAVVECTACGTADFPEEMPGGLCGPCRVRVEEREVTVEQAELVRELRARLQEGREEFRRRLRTGRS